MRIAILSCFYPYRGGISQFNASLFQALEKEHSVRAFNFSRQYPDLLFPGKTQYVSKDDIATVIDSDRILDTANPFSYIKTAKKIREWKPDLVVMRYWMPYFAPSQGWIARHLSKETKVISILDNVISHEPRFFDKFFTRYYLNSCDAFITLCNSVKDDLLDFKPDAEHLVSPHPLYSHFGKGVDRKSAAVSLGIDPQKKTILFFGLIRDYKGLDILLESFKELDSSYQLIIAGEPYGSFNHYQTMIDSLENKNNVTLHTRYIPDSEVAIFFCAADVCVLPYKSATQSGISSISYHFEVPLITTDVGGLKETVGDRGTGMVVEKADAKYITAAIKAYFSDQQLKSKLIENIKLEKKRLSWDDFAQKLIGLYNKIK